jgi:hypothetical protein
MDTLTKATLAIGAGFLFLIVLIIGALGTANGCATGETQQLITYQNAPNGEWVTEPVYADCEGK